MFKKPANAIITVIVMLLSMAGILMSGRSSAPGTNWDAWGAHEKQYEALTESISTLHVGLGERPAAFLSEMDNPYDPIERSIAAAENDSYALIDVAYYNDKYYIYFGLTPELLLFLPVKLLTGRTPPTWICDIITAILCVPAAFIFCGLFVSHFTGAHADGSRSSGRRSVLLECSMAVLLIGALGLPYLAAFCTTYSMPSVTGLFLMLCGLSFFLSAEKADGKLSRPRLVIGSVLLALTVGCRPTMCLSFLLLFAIFAGAIKRGDFFRPDRSSMANTLCVILPAIVTALPFLAYNLLRFGNPFDFGYRYLLTTRDLLHGVKTTGESLTSAWLLSLSPPNLSSEFPFMQIVDYTGRHADTLYVEPLFGGLLPLHPFITAGLAVLVIALILSAGKKRAGAGSYAGLFSVISLVTGLVILMTDSVVAGVSQRYSSDFALFFFMPAMLGFCLAYAALSGNDAALSGKHAGAARLLVILAVMFVIVEVFLSASSILCDGRYFAMKDWNPEVYEKIRGML